MKYSSILKITLINSLALMLIGSFLASCNKQKTITSSYYSSIEQTFPKRSIASLQKSQDNSIQSYIYCQNNSLTPHKCLQSKIIGVNPEQKEIITSRVKAIDRYIFMKYETYIFSKISKSLKSCMTTKEKKIQRCVHGHLDTANQQILNKVTRENSSTMNPDEILYLKKALKKHLIQIADQNINISAETTLVKIEEEIVEKSKMLRSRLLNKTNWLKKITGISNANQKCIDLVNTQLDNTPKTNILLPALQKRINKHVCLSVLSNKKIITLLDNNTNKFIELKFEDLQSNIDKNVTKMISKCKLKDSSCFQAHWETYSKSMANYTITQFKDKRIPIDEKVIKHKLNKRKDQILKRNKI